MNVISNLVNLTADTVSNTNGPNFAPLSNLVISWVNPILNFMYVIVGAIATVVLILYGVKAFRAKDANDRQEVMTKIGWWFLGLVIVGLAAAVTNIIFPIITNNTALSLNISNNS